jgi:hypothetical protein
MTRRLIIYLLRRMWPFVWQSMKFTCGSMLITLLANLSGLPKACDAIASEWTQKGIDAGFPTLHEKWLYRSLYLVALCQYVFGFVLLSHIVVWLFWWIF